MKKITPILKVLFLLLIFRITLILPQALPVTSICQTIISNILSVIGGAIIVEVTCKIFSIGGIWSEMRYFRDKVVWTACMFILMIATALHDIPTGNWKKSLTYGLVSFLLCFVIIQIGGSSTLKSIFTPKSHSNNNPDNNYIEQAK